jgi:hypothetical protein
VGKGGDAAGSPSGNQVSGRDGGSGIVAILYYV